MSMPRRHKIPLKSRAFARGSIGFTPDIPNWRSSYFLGAAFFAWVREVLLQYFRQGVKGLRNLEACLEVCINMIILGVGVDEDFVCLPELLVVWTTTE